MKEKKLQIQTIFIQSDRISSDNYEMRTHLHHSLTTASIRLDILTTFFQHFFNIFPAISNEKCKRREKKCTSNNFVVLQQQTWTFSNVSQEQTPSCVLVFHAEKFCY